MPVPDGMIIHWHPDGLIYVRDLKWNALFEGTASEVELFIGEPLPPLPVGVKERQYFWGSHVVDFNEKGEQLAGNPEDFWPQGNKIAAKKEELRLKHEEKKAELRKRADPAELDKKIKDEEQKTAGGPKK